MQTQELFEKALEAFDQENLEQALEYSRQLLALDDQNFHFWDLEAKIRFYLGEVQAAERALERACEVAPGEIEPLIAKASFLNATEAFEESLVFSKKALELTDSDEQRTEIFFVQAEAKFGLAQAELHDHIEMLTSDEGFAETTSSDHIPLNPEIDQLLQEGLSLTQKIIEVHKDWSDVWDLRAGFFMLSQQPERTIECLQEAVRISPETKDYWHKLGNMLEQTEDAEGAQKAYTELYQLELNTPKEGLEFSLEEFKDIALLVWDQFEEDLAEDMEGGTPPPFEIHVSEFPSESELTADGFMDPWIPFNFHMTGTEAEPTFHITFYQRNVERELSSDDPEEVAYILRNMVETIFANMTVEDDILEA